VKGEKRAKRKKESIAKRESRWEQLAKGEERKEGNNSREREI